MSPIDKSATVADAHLPAYKTYATYPDLNVESLRARRDELVVGIIGSEAQKGYKKLFAEASKDGNVVDESIIVYDPDPENAKFDELVRKVNNYIGEEKSGAVTHEDMLTAAKLLYEDHDLNGLYGIYQTAYKFYANFVYMRKDNSVRSNGGYLSEDPDNLAGFKAKEIIANAKQVLKKKLKISGADDETRSDELQRDLRARIRRSVCKRRFARNCERQRAGEDKTRGRAKDFRFLLQPSV